MQKFISWNVNGLRACLQKGFLEFFNEADADFFCVQESRLQAEQFNLNINGYRSYFNFAQKKGYSGTGIFAKKEAKNCFLGIGADEFDREGRAVTLEYDSFYLVTVYAPNSQRELTRLPYRMEWEDAFRGYISALKAKKPVIFCGDLNVAHNEIDLANPKANKGNAGFTDVYRYLFPDRQGAYTWWSYMGRAREKNIGWRIDYFCASDDISHKLTDANIYGGVYGSDHCPVGITVDLR